MGLGPFFDLPVEQHHFMVAKGDDHFATGLFSLHLQVHDRIIGLFAVQSAVGQVAGENQNRYSPCQVNLKESLEVLVAT